MCLSFTVVFVRVVHKCVLYFSFSLLLVVIGSQSILLFNLPLILTYFSPFLCSLVSWQTGICDAYGESGAILQSELVWSITREKNRKKIRKLQKLHWKRKWKKAANFLFCGVSVFFFNVYFVIHVCTFWFIFIYILFCVSPLDNHDKFCFRFLGNFTQIICNFFIEFSHIGVFQLVNFHLFNVSGLVPFWSWHTHSVINNSCCNYVQIIFKWWYI